MSERRRHLLDERALTGPRFFGAVLSLGATAAMAETLNKRAAVIAATEVNELQTGVIIDGRALPNKAGKMPGGEKERTDSVIATARNIRAQAFGGNVAILATVEASAFDPSAKQRSQLSDLGVEPLRINRGVNHAAAINEAALAMPFGNGVGIALPAGNRFATDQALRTASLYIADGAAGAFGPRVLDRHGSTLAQRLLNGDSEYTMQYGELDDFPTSDQTGFMPDAGSAFNLAMLNGDPLDERFGQGGGLREWADNVQDGPGSIWYDPAMAVHDAGARNMSKWSLLDEVMREEPTDY